MTGNITMSDTESTAMRLVEGGELHLVRSPGANWAVNFYNPSTTVALADGLQRGERGNKIFRGETFKTPDEAAAACRRLVVL
jgi:hypothetical protein